MPESVDARHLLLIGAGPGVGASVVRRFGREGFRSTLISRGETVEQLAPTLRSDLFEGVVVVNPSVLGFSFLWSGLVLSSLSALGCADDLFQLSRLLMSLWDRLAVRSLWSLPGQWLSR